MLDRGRHGARAARLSRRTCADLSTQLLPAGISSNLLHPWRWHDVGSLASEHELAVKICEQLNVVVLSAGYRKAPEHLHPAQVNDCYAALSWMSANAVAPQVDGARLGVYGGSAGGNLAIATAHDVARQGHPRSSLRDGSISNGRSPERNRICPRGHGHRSLGPPNEHRSMGLVPRRERTMATPPHFTRLT